MDNDINDQNNNSDGQVPQRHLAIIDDQVNNYILKNDNCDLNDQNNISDIDDQNNNSDIDDQVNNEII